MPSYYVPAQDELSSSVERVVLPGNEDYVLKVLDITENTKNDFNGKPVDVFTVKFAAESFADGAALEDNTGAPVESSPWLWKDIDPLRMGFKTDGTASLARQFFCAINGIADLTQRVPEGDTQDLIGRTVIGTLVVYKKKDGSFGNKITGFKTPSRRRGTRAAAPDEGAAAAAPVRRGQSAPSEEFEVDEEYLRAVASLVNDSDDPSDEEVDQIKADIGAARRPLDDLPF